MNKNVILLLLSLCHLTFGLCIDSKDSMQSFWYNKIQGKWKIYCIMYKPGLKRPGYSIQCNEPIPVGFKQKGDTVIPSGFDSNLVTCVYDIKIYKDSIQLTSSYSIKLSIIPEGTYCFRLVEKNQFDELFLTNAMDNTTYILKRLRLLH